MSERAALRGGEGRGRRQSLNAPAKRHLDREKEASMNRKLNTDELNRVRDILDDLRARLREAAAGDDELLFALRRKLYKELTYDERGKPMERRRLKRLKYDEQNGKCAICG